MRDIVDNNWQWYFNRETRDSLCDSWSTDSTSLKNYHRRIKARGNIIQSDGLTATPYRAYDYGCSQNGTVKGEGNLEYTFCDGQWSWITTRRYEGKASIPPWDIIRPYMRSGGYPDVPSSIVATARNRALGRLVKSKVDIGESLGELRETGTLLASTLVNLTRSFTALRRGQIGEAMFHMGLAKVRGARKRTRKDLSGAKNNGDRGSYYVGETVTAKGAELHNRWLEFQFGWKPLVSDIINMRQAILDQMAREDFVSLTTTERRTYDLSQFSTSRYEITGSSTTGVEIGMKYRVTDSRLAGMSALGLSNPFNLGWQLLPTSFVMDWFFSIGDFLQGLTAHHGLEYVGGYETHFTRSDGHTVLDHYYPEIFHTGDPASFSCKSRAHQRFVGVDFPTPGIAVKLDLNLGKVITSLALLNR